MTDQTTTARFVPTSSSYTETLQVKGTVSGLGTLPCSVGTSRGETVLATDCASWPQWAQQLVTTYRPSWWQG